MIIITAGALLTQLVLIRPRSGWEPSQPLCWASPSLRPVTCLSLGLVGQRAFPRQISRNEFGNRSGNLASPMAIYLAVGLFKAFSVIWLMIVTAPGALIALRMISPDRIDQDTARRMIKGGGAGGRAPVHPACRCCCNRCLIRRCGLRPCFLIVLCAASALFVIFSLTIAPEPRAGD